MKKSLRASLTAIAFLSLGFSLSACSSLSLQQVDFGWPVESVLKVKDNNMVAEGRYAISFNVAPLATEEFQDSTALKGKQLRLLRNSEGFYFITGTGFKYVYVLAGQSAELHLKQKFEVSKGGLKQPAFNQRDPYVELIDGKDLRLLMTGDDLYEEADLRAERH